MHLGCGIHLVRSLVFALLRSGSSPGFPFGSPPLGSAVLSSARVRLQVSPSAPLRSGRLCASGSRISRQVSLSWILDASCSTRSSARMPLSEAGIGAIVRPGSLQSMDRRFAGPCAGAGLPLESIPYACLAHRLNDCRKLRSLVVGRWWGNPDHLRPPRTARPYLHPDHPHSVVLLLQGSELCLRVVPPTMSVRPLRADLHLGCFHSQGGLSGGPVDVEGRRPQGVSPVLSPLRW